MKRLFFGLTVMAIAAATAAFTTPKSTPKDLTDYYFEFPTTTSPTVANVQDESKWAPALDMDNCPNGQQRACKIRVDQEHVISGVLQSSADIQAALNGSNAVVTGGELLAYTNRANP